MLTALLVGLFAFIPPLPFILGIVMFIVGYADKNEEHKPSLKIKHASFCAAIIVIAGIFIPKIAIILYLVYCLILIIHYIKDIRAKKPAFILACKYLIIEALAFILLPLFVMLIALEILFTIFSPLVPSLTVKNLVIYSFIMNLFDN